MPLSKKLQELVDRISRNREKLLQSVTGLNEAQLNHKAEETGWSIGDVLNHVSLTDEANAKLTSNMLKRARASSLPPDPDPNLSVIHSMDELFPRMDGTKFQAPEFVKPHPACFRRRIVCQTQDFSRENACEYRRAGWIRFERSHIPTPICRTAEYLSMDSDGRSARGPTRRANQSNEDAARLSGMRLRFRVQGSAFRVMSQLYALCSSSLLTTNLMPSTLNPEP